MDVLGKEENKNLLMPSMGFSTKPMDKRCWCALLTLLLLVVVIVICSLLLVAPGDDDDDDTSTTDVAPGDDDGDTSTTDTNVVSSIHPYSLTMTLTSNSDTKSGLGGKVQLCSGNKECCQTDRFQFKVPTVLYFEDHKNCAHLAGDKNLNMSIKVLNEDPAKVTIYRMVLNLEDGSTYHTFVAGSLPKSSWSQPFPLEQLDISKNHVTMVKVNFKNVKENPKNITYVTGTRIELKIKGESDNRGCYTNPLPWPSKEGTVELYEVESLGLCFTFNIKDAGENLLVRYQAPPDAPFTISKILLTSYEEQTFGWLVNLSNNGSDTNKWKEAEFDDDY